MLGYSGQVIPDKFAQVAHTQLAGHEGFGDQEAGGMSQGFENGDTFGCGTGKGFGHGWLFGKLTKELQKGNRFNKKLFSQAPTMGARNLGPSTGAMQEATG